MILPGFQASQFTLGFTPETNFTVFTSRWPRKLSDRWRAKILQTDSSCVTGDLLHGASEATTSREMAHLRETEGPSVGVEGIRGEDRDGHESRRG